MADIVDDAGAACALIESGARFAVREGLKGGALRRCCGQSPAYVSVAGGRKPLEALECRICGASTSARPSRQKLAEEWNNMG